MIWYDWVLWAGVLYMAIGSDFSMNWTTGVVFGKRIDKNSSNPFNRLYYYIWAKTDPMHGPVDPSLVDDSGVTAPINKQPLQPRFIAGDQFNMILTLGLEIIIMIGMFTHGAYLRPAVFIFVYRALNEFCYAAQLIWGKPGLQGGAALNYILIGLLPQTLIPLLLVMRFATSVEPNILWWQPWVFVALPYAIFVWTAIVSSKAHRQYI